MTIADAGASPLSFSIIVNTTDRADALRTLLRALEQQSYPHFEVIAVVGPTRDHTLEMLAEYGNRVRIFRCPEANLSQSRNIGLRAARGDIVAYIDDDAVPCRNWLAQMVQMFEDAYVQGTGGVVYLVTPRAATTQHRIGITSSLAEQINVRNSAIEHIAPPRGFGRQWVTRMMGTNMAYRRDALLDVGGFDEYYIWVTDETDLIVRLVNAGHVIHPVKEAPVYHVPASSRNRVAYTNIGRWWLQTQSSIYFAIKNGGKVGDHAEHIWLVSLHLLNGHWLWYRRLWRDGQLSFAGMLWKSLEEMVMSASAAVSGRYRPRRVIPAAEVQACRQSTETIHPFQNQQSPFSGAVDPVSGAQPIITLPDPPLRLCLTSGLYPPAHFDGIGHHTHAMARGLFELGHTVHVVTRGEQEQVSFYDGAYVHRIPYRLDRYPRYQHLPDLHHSLNYSHAIQDKVQRLILNDGIQIVDSPLWQMEGLVTAVSKLLPVVVRLQTSVRKVSDIQQDRDPGKQLIGEMEQALLDRANYLVPNSKAIIETVRHIYNLADDRPMTIIPHGIVPVPDEDVRPFPLENPPKNLTVLYVGRLEKRKGIQALFSAIPAVLARVPQARFIIAGSDNSQHDGFHRQTGMAYPDYFRSQFPFLAEHVRFLGQVSEEEKAALYQQCDLFVAPSLYESFGLIYLEAMNYAKPVIGCQAGGIPEVVEHGVVGLLVEPDAAPPLAEAIASLLESPQRLYEMGVAGRQRLLSNFTHVQMARRFVDVYRKTIRLFSQE